jgi:hypothetical protein
MSKRQIAHIGDSRGDLGVETVRAGDRGLSLAELAGSYADRQGGFLSLCFTSDFTESLCQMRADHRSSGSRSN